MHKLVKASDLNVGDLLTLDGTTARIDQIEKSKNLTHIRRRGEWRAFGGNATMPVKDPRKTATGRTKSKPELQNLPGARAAQEMATKDELSALAGVVWDDRSAEITHLKKENADQASQLMSMYRGNNVVEAKLTMLSALDSRDSHIVSLTRSLAEKDGEIAELHRQLALPGNLKAEMAKETVDYLVKIFREKQEPVEVLLCSAERVNGVRGILYPVKQLEAALDKAGVKHRYE